MDACTRDKLISIIQDECTRIRDAQGLPVADKLRWPARVNDVAMALNALRDMLMHLGNANDAEQQKQNELRMMRNVYAREFLNSDKLEMPDDNS